MNSLVSVSALLCAGCEQEEPTTRMRFVITRDASGKRVGQSINYCDACTEIINGGGHDVHERAEARVTFPRASEQQTAVYFGLYRQQCGPMMKAWLVQSFAALSEQPPTERLALLVAHELMVAECKRAPNQHESRLIGECVRDLLAIRFIERDLSQPKMREVI